MPRGSAAAPSNPTGIATGYLADLLRTPHEALRPCGEPLGDHLGVEGVGEDLRPVLEGPVGDDGRGPRERRLDQLAHDAHPIAITGDSYRTRATRRRATEERGETSRAYG